MFCYKCGKSVPDGAKFCGFCGAPQKKAASAEPKIVPTAPPQPQAVPSHAGPGGAVSGFEACTSV